MLSVGTHAHSSVCLRQRAGHALPARRFRASRVPATWVRAAQAAESTQEAPSQLELSQLTASLVTSLASLDRGLAASTSQAKRVEALVADLVRISGPPDLSEDQSELQGNWRLLYTSGFNSGSLGGSRPGPPAGLVPAVLGQIYQRIDEPTGKLDNIVEFLLAVPFRIDNTPALRSTLGHDYRVLPPSTVEIVFEDTSAEIVGGPSFLPKFSTPTLPEFLRPPERLRSATFECLFLDSSAGGLRITRGDRGELRIYCKEE